MTAIGVESPRIPHLVLSGRPEERGFQYGRQAAPQIRRSIDAYRRLLAHRAGMDWASAISFASRYEQAIVEFAPDCLAEMEGMARGAGVLRGEILALNARSELMFSAVEATAAESLSGECTSFAVLPEASANGHTLVGQNWDWMAFAIDTAVLLEVRRDDGPDFVTVAEAGHLAKVGFNAAGLGLCTNTLVSERDRGQIGVPYHVMLRALLDTSTMTDALRKLLSTNRALSANYLLSHADGLVCNVETTSGGVHDARVTLPEAGVLAHANHFLDPALRDLDVRVAVSPHSLLRYDVMLRALQRRRPGIGIEDLRQVLCDHRNYPDSVCMHPDERQPAIDQRITVASVIADMDAGEIWFSKGPPCLGHWTRFSLDEQLQRERSQRSYFSFHTQKEIA